MARKKNQLEDAIESKLNVLLIDDQDSGFRFLKSVIKGSVESGDILRFKLSPYIREVFPKIPFSSVCMSMINAIKESFKMVPSRYEELFGYKLKNYPTTQFFIYELSKMILNELV